MRPSPVLALMLLTLPAAAQGIRTGLVSHWPLDAVSPDGLTTPDMVSGNHLQLVGMSAADFTPGRRGNAASFDGASQILTLDTDPALTPGLPLTQHGSLTVAMWVRATGTTQTDRRFFSEASLATNAPLFGLGTDNLAAPNGTNAVSLYVRNDANSAVINHRKTTGRPLDGTWHHLAVTDSNGTIRYYIDGVADATTFAYTRGTLTAGTLTLGAIRRLSGTLAYFSGQLDEVAVWSRALTAAEVASLTTDNVAVDRPGPWLEGDRLTLTAPAVLSGPAAYQWRRNGSPIAAATDSTHVIPALGTGSDGSYDVLINGVATTPVAVTFTPDPTPAPTTNLVSWWPGESMDAATVPAKTPDPWGGHPLDCVAMEASHLVPGQFGNAFSFDGVTQHAMRTTGFPIAGNPEYSISLWVKGDGTTQNDLRFFAEGSVTSNNPLLGLGTGTGGSNRLRVFLRSDAGTALVVADSAAAVLDDQWHHVVLTDRNGQMRLYVDGQMDASVMRYNRTGQTFTLDQTSLGAIQRAAVSHWFRGLVDDVAVWNRVLTYGEVQVLRNTGVPTPVSATPPEVTQNPRPRTINAGRTLTLSVQATGTAPLQYQWLRNDEPLPTQTDFTLTIPSAQPSDSGSYRCRVTNTAGSDLSDPAAVQVLPVTGLTSGLVACYAFEGGSPETPDLTGTMPLTLSGTDPATLYQPGVTGMSLNLDGVDDLAVRTWSGTGRDVPLTSGDEFTIAFWVRGSGFGQNDRRVFSESSTVNAQPLFNLGTDNAGAHDLLEFYIRGDGGAAPVDHTSSVMPVFDGTWHHVVYTDYLGQGQLYVDGMPDVALSYARQVATFTTMSVGGIVRATNSHWFAGSVDQLCLWNRALSGEEAALVRDLTSGSGMAVTGVATLPDGRLQLTVRTLLGARTYRIEATADPATGPWQPVAGAVVSPVAGDTFTAEVPVTGAGPRLFLRAATNW